MADLKEDGAVAVSDDDAASPSAVMRPAARIRTTPSTYVSARRGSCLKRSPNARG